MISLKLLVNANFNTSIYYSDKIMISSCRIAKYLGYQLDMADKNPFSNQHLLSQISKIERYLPVFICLRKLLSLEQALQIIKSYIYSGIFGICPPSQLQKLVINKANIVLRKFISCAYKTYHQFVTPGFVSITELLQSRFSHFIINLNRKAKRIVNFYKICASN